MDFDWNDIPLLLKLADTGSMSQAGRLLGLDASTVSRRVAAAEKALNVRLFIREPTGYQATDAGKIFLAHAEAVFDRVETMILDTRTEAEGVSGVVNVTAIDVLFTHWLVWHLPGLLAAHPALQVNLIGDNRDLSFTRREADLAIRLNRPSEELPCACARSASWLCRYTARRPTRDSRASNGRMCHGLPIQWSSRACPRCVADHAGATTVGTHEQCVDDGAGLPGGRGPRAAAVHRRRPRRLATNRAATGVAP